MKEAFRNKSRKMEMRSDKEEGRDNNNKILLLVVEVVVGGSVENFSTRKQIRLFLVPSIVCAIQKEIARSIILRDKYAVTIIRECR